MAVDLPFWNQVAVSQTSAGQLNEAVTTLLQLLQAGDHPVLQNNLGSAFARLGRLADARRHFHLAIRLHPAYATPWYNLAVLYQEQKHQAKAIQCYQRALRVNPRHVSALNNYGLILESDGHLEQAEGCYLRGLAADACCATLWYNLGNCLTRQGQWIEAIGPYTRAVDLCPDHTDARANLAYCRRHQALAASLEIGPGTDTRTAAREFLEGLRYHRTGAWAAAMGCYEAAKAHDPAHIDVRCNLMRIHFVLGDLPRALQEYDEIVRLDPGDGVVYRDTAVCLFFHGMILDALAVCERGLSACPTQELRELRSDLQSQQQLWLRDPDHSIAQLVVELWHSAIREFSDTCGAGSGSAAKAILGVSRLVQGTASSYGQDCIARGTQQAPNETQVQPV